MGLDESTPPEAFHGMSPSKAVAPDSVHLIESTRDIDELGQMNGPLALLSQTTLSLDEWQDLREYAEVKFPDIWMTNRSDL